LATIFYNITFFFSFFFFFQSDKCRLGEYKKRLTLHGLERLRMLLLRSTLTNMN